MKLTQFNLKIFVDELRMLSEEIPKVANAAEGWLEKQEEREKYGYYDQWGTQSRRTALENRLSDIRQRLALVYDFMSDRGLVDFEPTLKERMNGRGEGTQHGRDFIRDEDSREGQNENTGSDEHSGHLQGGDSGGNSQQRDYNNVRGHVIPDWVQKPNQRIRRAGPGIHALRHISQGKGTTDDPSS